jgi:hypothetical protein
MFFDETHEEGSVDSRSKFYYLLNYSQSNP